MNYTKPSFIIGYTTRRHLLLDLDNTTLRKIIPLIRIIMKDYPYVGDCVIMESSTRTKRETIRYNPLEGIKVLVTANNYHVIFDNEIPYEESLEIIEVLANLDVLNKEYLDIRLFRGDMTLRTNGVILTRIEKRAPTICMFIHNKHTKNKGEGIRKYLKFWRISKAL